MSVAGLSVLIATRNRREDLLRTLGATRTALSGVEVRVLDDGSIDGTTEAVAATFPSASIERHPTGIGYIAARNRLLDGCRSGVALTLDDDAEPVTPDFAARLLAHFEAEPRCGVVACRVVWGRERPANTISTASPRQVRDFVGCGHAWRLTAWREAGPYPEWLGFYGEERWASLELHQRGWRVDYVPSLVVHHRAVPGERPAAERRRRGRLHFRSGVAVALLTMPAGRLPRRLGSMLTSQARTLVRRYGVGGLVDLVRVGASLARLAPRIVRDRRPLDAEAWRRWEALPPGVLWGEEAEP